MFDTARGKPVQVRDGGKVGSDIMVSMKHQEQVLKLLSDHKIPYWVEHNVISVDDGPFIVFINLGLGTDPNYVQALLDQAS
jgi:hypothetical protein